MAARALVTAEVAAEWPQTLIFFKPVHGVLLGAIQDHKHHVGLTSLTHADPSLAQKVTGNRVLAPSWPRSAIIDTHDRQEQI